MQSPSDTATQLQEARHRIALLEQELATLRSTPNIAPHNPSSPRSLQPRPIMTRRASAAAAAAAAVSAVAADLSPPLAPPLSNSTLNSPQPASPISTPSPAPSEVSRHVSEQASQISPLPSNTSDQNSATIPANPMKKDSKRRPLPLPALKTATTKKERVTLVAKCTEPRPGQTRYWTCEEHEKFLEAVAEYGEKAYVAISNYVETRTPKQVRTHAQKFQMKMARLARQSIEAGEPVRMPAGMSPVVQVNNADGKPALVALQPGPPGLPGIVSMPGRPHGHVSVVVAMPPSKMSGTKKRGGTKGESGGKKEGEGAADALVKVSSVASEESSSALTDPYIDYIAGEGGAKDEMELEDTFAAKLSQTLHEQNGKKDEDGDKFLVSGGSSNDSGSVGGAEDDDLEDLKNLEDQDLSFAAFTGTGENWLLSDVTV